jgi:hypothetical protein
LLKVYSIAPTKDWISTGLLASYWLTRVVCLRASEKPLLTWEKPQEKK